jgi:teichuronic acid biosynthesis glycosyltransferase TuaC
VKALLFSNLFPTSAKSGRGIFTLQIAEEMARLCDLTVAVPLPWFPRLALARKLLPQYAEFGHTVPVLGWKGFSAHYLRYPLIPKVSEAVHAQLISLGVAGRIARLHRRIGFDVINAHWLYPDGVAAVALGRRLGIPVVLTGLGCDVNDSLHDPRLRSNILGAVAAAAAVTTVSAPLAQSLIEAGVPGEKITVIPNGVDTVRFKPRDAAACRREVGESPDGPLIVCVSRLSSEKGVRFLVHAMHVLRATVPDARLAFVGDGPQRAELEELARTFGLQNAVRFVGNVEHAKVSSWLGAATIACMPSLREGHPNAAMEALASGRPLVASAVGALPGMIQASAGVLVPAGDPAALAAGLGRALGNSWDAAAINASVAQSSWAGGARQYVQVLERAVREAATAARGVRALG